MHRSGKVSTAAGPRKKQAARKRPTLGRRARLVRNGIIESAARSFAEKGFVGTTMEDVAKEAGFAPSSLYGYFGGKDELFVATLEMIADRILSAFDDPLVRELPLVERISWILRRVCQIIEPNREFFVLLFGQAPFLDWNASPPIAAVGKRVYRQVVERLASELRAGTGASARAKSEAFDTSYVIAGAFQSWVFRWLHGDMPDALQPSLARFLARVRPLLEAR